MMSDHGQLERLLCTAQKPACRLGIALFSAWLCIRNAKLPSLLLPTHAIVRFVFGRSCVRTAAVSMLVSCAADVSTASDVCRSRPA